MSTRRKHEDASGPTLRAIWLQTFACYRMRRSFARSRRRSAGAIERLRNARRDLAMVESVRTFADYERILFAEIDRELGKLGK